METQIQIRNDEETRSLFGRNDENLRLIQDAFKVQVVARQGKLKIIGETAERVEQTKRLLEELLGSIRKGSEVHREDLRYLLRSFQEHGVAYEDLSSEVVEIDSRRRTVIPRTPGQRAYVETIRKYDIVFGIGPAGTGKTYLAMAMAVNALKKGRVSRIILVRPAVEAGENLGFLPGDLYAKVSPYLRPLYDALYEMMDVEKAQHYIESGIIEVVPLAYMRGRTLNDSFIILDEAQNSTSDQMKMFLTRLGFDSKVVITGDITQVDLPTGRTSGLIHVQSVLKDIEGIAFSYFTEKDVVRHELVQKIIRAYEKNDKKSKN